MIIDLPPIDFSDGRWWLYVLMYVIARYLEGRASQAWRVLNGSSSRIGRSG